MTDGVWILAMVLSIGQHEVTVKPFVIFDSFQLCALYKEEYAEKLRVPMTCTQESNA